MPIFETKNVENNENSIYFIKIKALDTYQVKKVYILHYFIPL